MIGRTLVALGALLVAQPAQAQPTRSYPTARHGGNYMHNFYFPPAPSSTPWAPDWSPDGSSIAVAMSGSLWSVDPETGVARELTADEGYHSSPDWSPDGKWIVYTDDDGGERIQLAILDVEQGTSHSLTDDEWVYTDPVFSPDGSLLAYVSTKPSGYFNVYVRAIQDGRWSGPEVALSQDNSFGRSRLYFGEWDMNTNPAWLPDGRELLVVSNRDVPLGSGNVVRVPVAPDGVLDGTTVLREQTLYRTRPDVSIDGKRFVYSSTRGAADQFSNLWVQPTVGGEPYKLTHFSHDAFHPRWSPDGEWIAYISNEGGLPQLALLETYGGAQLTVHITERQWKRPVGVLELTTRRADTDEVTGARIHLTAADGKFYAPPDAYARVSAARDHLFHTEGRSRVELPVGEVSVTVVKGFEFWPQTAEVTIEEGQVATLVVDLEPMADVAAEGWYDGSTHVHMNYGGNLHNTLENLMVMSEAEDQDVVNEQVANKDNRILDYQFFVKGGGAHPLSTPDRLLVVGQEYRPPFYGHVFMFGMRDHLISPYTTGYEGTAIESLYPSNTDMLLKARAQGATVGYVHAFGGDQDPLEGTLGVGKGFMVDAALGATDALEWSAAGEASFHPLYAVWSNGLKVTAVGGEDSISNLHRSKLVGSVRTYVHTGDRGLDMAAWFEGLRAGHATVSTGPLVELTVNGKGPGESIELSGSGTVEVTARARCITPLSSVRLILDGQVVEEIPLSDDRKSATFTGTVKVGRSGWLHLRADGIPEERFPLDARYAQGFTNPVWLSVDGSPIRSRQAAEYAIRWIDKLRKMAEEWPGWRSDKEEEHVYRQFDEARATYERFAAEADDLERP